MHYEHVLKEIDYVKQEAVFQDKSGEIRQPYDFLHVVPDHVPHFQLAPFADGAQGFVDVDRLTMQHKKYPNVFALGDCTNIAQSKTAASAFSQAPVVVHNIKQLVDNGRIDKAAKFNGYSACPIYLGGGKLMLAEYNFEGKAASTFFKNQAYGSEIFFKLAYDLFSKIYYWLMPTGYWFGRHGIIRPRF